MGDGMKADELREDLKKSYIEFARLDKMTIAEELINETFYTVEQEAIHHATNADGLTLTFKDGSTLLWAEGSFWI
jgi:hypothetical protein